MKLKTLTVWVIVFFNGLWASSQHAPPDYLIKDDTTIVNFLLEQSRDTVSINANKAIDLAVKAKEMAEKINYIKGQAYALKSMGLGYYYQGKYLEALGYWRESLNIFERIGDEIGMANLLNNLAAILVDQGNNEKALEYSLLSLKLSEKFGDTLRILSALNAIAAIYYNKNETKDKALSYLLKALPLSEKTGNNAATKIIAQNVGEIFLEKNDYSQALNYFEKSIAVPSATPGDSSANAFALNSIGSLYLKKGNLDQALIYYNKGFVLSKESANKFNMARSLRNIANVHAKKNDYTAAFYYYNEAMNIAKEAKSISDLKDIYYDLSLTHSNIQNYKEALKYQSLYSAMKDTLQDMATAIQSGKHQFEFDMQKRDDSVLLAKNIQLEKLRFEKFTSENRFKFFFLLGGSAILLVIIILLFLNNRQKQKTNLRIERAYKELKDTQQQLILREKMASLGELTAGIAHEIQNPLNFVNNFSEVSNELIEEMHAEIEKGNSPEVKQIATDLKQNLEKISHHSLRADAIVKGMLQHSRSSSGGKEPTNINKLADEYLHLSYHGLRAKDKLFSAVTKTEYDESIEKINVIPQEIGRVILNIINNAFYAITEKKKLGLEGFEPTITVSTKRNNAQVEIKVRDNGIGIPQKVIDKIFQPFFTTKPTGQGTGLGLSLSYDIIKAHRGDLKVETKEGEGTAFTILLPYN